MAEEKKGGFFTNLLGESVVDKYQRGFVDL